MSKCSIQEAFAPNSTSAASTASTLLGLAVTLAQKRLGLDPESLTSTATVMTGLITATNSLGKSISESKGQWSKIPSSDINAFISAFSQLVIKCAELLGKRNPYSTIIFTSIDLFNLVYQYFSCEPPKKETPTTDPAQRQTSPLVIDLGFNGIETLASNRGIYFDLDNNGFAENTAWVRYTDGLLALDLNNNGLIDNGSELFGNHFVLQNGQKAANGFEALKEFDTDGNMSINHLDEIWNRLKIWQDLNRDGITQEGELKDLSLSGIQAINLNYLEKDNFDSNGNNHRQQSTVQWNDGKTSSINDVWFNVHLADTIDLSEVNISDELQSKLDKLPDVNGFGNLSRLQIAMAKNPALLEKVQHYLNSDFEVRKTLINDLIYEWAGCIDIDPKSRDPKSHYGHVIDARKVITLEVLTGHGYVGTWCWGEKDPNPHGQAAPLLNAEFNKFADYVSAYLSAQWEYSDIFEDIFHSMILNMGNPNSEQHSDVLNNKIETLLKTKDFLEIKKILNVAEHLGAYNAFIRNAWSNELQVLKSHFFELNSLFDDTFFNGTDGNDSVYGKNTDDFLMGGLGNDQLYGKEGSDIYAFGQNFGKDKIYDNRGQDAILFIDSNIKSENIIIRRVKENFNSIELIEIDDLGHESGNRIQIDNFFDFNGNLAEGAIETIKFNDDNRTIWDIDIIKDKLLSATSGDDDLYGYSGNDIIIGYEGNDMLSGNIGSDTYVFGKNFGQDTIHNYDQSVNRQDTVRFTEGWRQSDFAYRRENNNLVISSIQTADKVTVQDYFTNDADGGYQVDRIVFDDGTKLDVETVKSLVQQNTDGDDCLYAYNPGDSLSGGQGSDTLYGAIGADTLYGDEGNDHLDGGDGNDILDGGTDDDKLYGNNGNDTLIGGIGSDMLAGGNGDDTLEGSEGNDHLNGGDGNDILDGGTDDDKLYGNNGNDALIGGIGSDVLAGENGDDTLEGGEGNDHLNGGNGSDTYIFGKNFGQDTIYNYDKSANRQDTVRFTEGWRQSDFTYRRENNNLVISSIQTADKVTVQDYFTNDADGGYQVDRIVFDDGTKLDVETVKSLVQQSTDGDDTLIAYNSGSVVSGGKGNDLLIGAAGNDVLDGGEDNDILKGGQGEDIYVFSGRFGQDVIEEIEHDKALIRLNGIATDSVQLYRENDSLMVREIGTYNRIQIKNFFKENANTGITTLNHTLLIELDDGTVWNNQTIRQKALTGSRSDDVINGFIESDVMNGYAGNDTLSGNLGSDTYVFSPNFGNDNIIEVDADNSIRFEGIRADELKFHRDNSDLVIRQIGTDNQITVRNQFDDKQKDELSYTESKHIAQIIFDDGVIWDADQIKAASVVGDNGNETIVGFYDDDLMIGNGGNDILNGQLGRDTYVFVPNWGVDTIIDTDTDSILRFNHIKPSDIRLIREGNNLIVMRIGSNDRITVAEHFKNETERTTHNRIAQIVFDDGTVWDTAVIKQQVLTGTDSEDVLSNSFVEGGTLYGLAGDDRLYGGLQQDTLIGGEGNDELSGGSGSDIFVFGKGWGQDIIQAEYNQPDQDVDTIVFTDVYADEVLLRYAEEGDLVLRRLNSDDQITVRGRSDAAPTIEQIIFADGITWSAQDIHLNALKGTDAADTIIAIHATDGIYGGLGDDVLTGIYVDGQNRLFGEEGDDILTGSGILDGGTGNDILTGAGTLNGGTGQDKLIGYGTLSGGLDDDHLILDIGINKVINSTLLFNVTVLDGGEGNDVLDASKIGSYFAFTEVDAGTLLPEPPDLSDPYASVFTLRGGKGDDVLYGSAVADVYEFNLGDGHDTLIERKLDEAWMDIQASYDAIHFGADIRSSEIKFIRQGDDLILRHQNGLDSITVKEHFNSTSQAANHFKIDEVRFADGTVLTYAQIDEKAVWQGSDADEQMMGYRNISDTILAGAGNDQIFAQAGHDVVDGQAGNDYLDGGEGNDTLYGGSGDDSLTGGLGNDVLNGGAGNDTYLYGKNGGKDILDLSGGGIDTLYFMDGITRAQMGFKREGNDLLITVDNDMSRSVRVKDHFLGGEKAISCVAPNGGVAIFANEISRLVGNSGAAAQPNTPVKPTTPTQPAPITGTGQIKGTDGEDTLIGSKTSNDVMQGFKGNDTYIYTGGADTIMETGGIDTLLFAGGIAFNQVSSGLMKSGNDLVLRVNKSNQNKVTLKDFFKGGANIVETISFETGGSLNAKQIFELFKVPMVNPEPPYTHTVNGTERDDVDLTGTVGNDLVRGLAGNDVLNGLAGNDHLIGGTGNDTYVFAPGFGQDTVDNTGGGFDRILFDGIDFNQVGSGLTRMNDDLILKVSGSNDQVTLINWFKGGEHVVQQIDFASGGQITSSQLFKIFGMNDLTPPANADTVSRSHARSFAAAQSMTQAMSAFGGGDDSGSNSFAALNNTVHQPWTYLTTSA